MKYFKNFIFVKLELKVIFLFPKKEKDVPKIKPIDFETDILKPKRTKLE